MPPDPRADPPAALPATARHRRLLALAAATLLAWFGFLAWMAWG